MDEDVKICRLCLKIGEKDVPYFPITSNNTVLHNLNLLSVVTIKKVGTEDPLICNLCDNKLKQLASFQEIVISNEFQIQCNEKNDGNSFLEAMSKDFDKICRLCLKTSDDATQLQKNWKDCEQLFAQCNILLNLNVKNPSKICNTCDTMLKTIWNFVMDCSKTEKHIADQASKTENLSLKEILVEISTVKRKILETGSSGEDNNNVSQELEEDETSSTNVVGQLKVSPSNEAENVNKVTDNVKSSISNSERDGESGASKDNDTKERISPENTECELNISLQQDQKTNATGLNNSTESSSESILRTEPPCDVSPPSTTTKKTYARSEDDQKTDHKVANNSTESSTENILCTQPSCDISPHTPKTYARSDQHQKTDDNVGNNSTELPSKNILSTEPPCDASPLSNKTPKTYARSDQYQKTNDKVANNSTESSSENICTKPPCDPSPLSNKTPKTCTKSDQDQKTNDKVANNPTESSSESILCTESSADVSPLSNKTPKTYARSDQDQNTDDKVANNPTESSSESILCTESSADVSPLSNKTPKTYARSDQDQNTDDKVANNPTESSSESILCTESSVDVSPLSNKTPKTYARSDQDQKTNDKVANIESSSENILCTKPSVDVSPLSNKTPKTYARSDQNHKTNDKVANIESSSENILCTKPSVDVSPLSNKTPKTYARSDQDQKTNDKVANIESSSENILCTKPSVDVSPLSNKTPKTYARSDQDQKTNDKVANIESSSENILCTKPSVDVSPLSNKTPKTYARARSKVPQNTQAIASPLKLNFLSEIRLRDQNKPSTSKLKENESIIDQIISDFSDGSEYSSIDASPVRNVADITLDMTLGPGGVIQTENGEFQKDNITQELIYLLEGTEEDVQIKNVAESDIGNSKQYKNTEELLRVLEDDDDDGDVTEIYDQIKDVSEKDGKKQEEVKSSQTKKNQIIALNRPVVQAVSTVEEEEKKVQNLKNLKGKSINTVFKRSTLVKKGKITSNISNKSGGTQVVPRKHNLRQKTIIMSFREMLNMKPLKNKPTPPPPVADNLIKEISETNNTIEMVQVQDKGLEIKNRAEESELRPEASGKKRPVKKTPKNAIDDQEKGIAHKPAKTLSHYKLQDNKKLVETSSDTLDVSQIEDISFEKIHIKKISLVDDIPSKNTETQAKSSAKKAPVKRMHKNKIESANNTDLLIPSTVQESTKAPETAAEKVSVVDKKRAKRKTAVENQKEVVPIKRPKKSTQKQVSEDNNELDTNQKDLGSLSARKGRARACKEAAKSKQVDADNETNGDEPENSEESDDESESEAASQSSNKPVVVIIRRRKTKNKAQRDKTWSQLTGKPVGEDGGNNEEIVDEEDVPKKRRGRPRLPDADRKPKKPKPKYYTCSCCAFKTISQNILIQHQYIHNVVDTAVLYTCHQCGFKTPSKDLLEEHKVSHLMSETIYKCMFCEFSHKKKNSTMYHTLRHEDKDIANMFYCLVLNQDTDEEQYECFQCEYQSAEEAVMPDHVMDHQVEKIKNSVMTKFSCKKCLYKTKFEDTFKRHQEMHKEEKKRVKVAKKDIKEEIKKEPEEIEPQPDESQAQDEEEVAEALTVYSCDLCCYHTYNKRSLSNHVGLKHTRYAPPDANLEARRNKKRKPLPDEIYRCNECDYTTQKKPHLTRHMIIHRSKENMEFFECTYCIFETKHRRSYKRHMEVKHKVIV